MSVWLATWAYLQDTKSVDKKSAYQLESDGKGCAQSFAYFQIDPTPMCRPSVLACSVLGRRLPTFVLEFEIMQLFNTVNGAYPDERYSDVAKLGMRMSNWLSMLSAGLTRPWSCYQCVHLQHAYRP